MTRRDPIVDEVRKYRAAIARRRGNDLDAIIAAFQREGRGRCESPDNGFQMCVASFVRSDLCERRGPGVIRLGRVKRRAGGRRNDATHI